MNFDFQVVAVTGFQCGIPAHPVQHLVLKFTISFHRLQVQLQDMAAMTEYAGPEAFSDVLGLVNNAMIQDDQLQQQV